MYCSIDLLNQMAQVQALIGEHNVVGARYAPQATGEVDTENFEARAN